MPFVEYSGEVVSGKQDKTFEKDSSGFKLDSQDDLSKQLGNNWWHLPAAMIGTLATWEAGKAINNWLKSRQAPEATRIEPTFNAEPQAPVQAAPAQEPRLTPQQVIERNKAAGIGVQPPVQNAPTTPVQAPAAVTPPVGQAQPPIAPAQPPVPSVAQAVATGQSPSQAVQLDVAKQLDEASGQPSVVKKARAPKTEQFTFKSVPEGHVFIPEMGNLDQAMQNIYGEEGRKHARDLLTGGKHFGFAPAGKGEYNKAVKELSTQYMQALQGQIPETLLSREERIAQGVPHGGQGTFGGLGKIAKVGGVVGTLLTAAEAAKAAQQGNMAPAKEMGFDVGAGALLASILGGPAALAGALGFGSSGLNKDEEKQLAERRRIGAIGAGRGVAPPSMYQQ